MNLNQLLKNFRVKNNMTQEELAQRIHVSHQTISKWEQGINTPSIDNLLLLSDLYNISLDELIRGGNYLKKPFIVGKKVSKLRLIIFFFVWSFISLLFTGYNPKLMWIFGIVFVIGIVFILPILFEDYWIIEKKGLSIQNYPNSSLERVKVIYSFLINPNKKILFLSFEEIEMFEIIYNKMKRYSPFDYRADDFHIKVTTKTNESYELSINSHFKSYLPQTCSYLEKKDILIIDKNNLIDAIVEGENVFEYMHEQKIN